MADLEVGYELPEELRSVRDDFEKADREAHAAFAECLVVPRRDHDRYLRNLAEKLTVRAVHRERYERVLKFHAVPFVILTSKSIPR